MARCERCFGCQSQWDSGNCKHCNYPDSDTRTVEQIQEDNKFIEEYYKEPEYE